MSPRHYNDASLASLVDLLSFYEAFISFRATVRRGDFARLGNPLSVVRRKIVARIYVLGSCSRSSETSSLTSIVANVASSRYLQQKAE